METHRKIAFQLSEEAILEQLIEECGELIQAAAKRLRKLRGENYTPVSMSTIYENLQEEIADVFVCLNVLGLKIDSDNTYIYKLREDKAKRWESRLEGNESKDM